MIYLYFGLLVFFSLYLIGFTVLSFRSSLLESEKDVAIVRMITSLLATLCFLLIRAILRV